jgi:catechol 1,2-dioxygenase
MAEPATVALIDEFLDMVRDFITRRGLTYQEYEAVKKYLISVGEAGEWPLLLDAFFESWINTSSYRQGADWTPAAITGPYYKSGAPLLSTPFTLPSRPDEPGEPLLFHARVTDADNIAIAGAELDVWHASNDGIYSFFHADMPATYLLRGRMRTDEDGRATFRSIVPVPYKIPDHGPTGYLMNEVLGRHSWRPAHLHLTVTAPGYRPLTTQLYFKGDPYLDSDSCSAVKSALIIDLASIDIDGRSGCEGHFTFALCTERGSAV